VSYRQSLPCLQTLFAVPQSGLQHPWQHHDPELFQPHHTTKQQRKDLATRMKDTNDELKLVIVRDMWLTGFDAPSMHTGYFF
jgi:hypothetical protein